MKFCFCPCCSASLTKKKIQGKLRLVCSSCDFIFFQNSKPCVGGLILRGAKDKEILLTKRAFPPKQGTWDIPGGFLEKGEDPRIGLKREIKEELGVNAEVMDLYDIIADHYGVEKTATLNLFYFVKLLGNPEKPSDDISEFAFFPLHKPPQNIGFQNVKKVLSRLRKE